MISDNKTVNKAQELLINRREKLRDKKQNLRNMVDEKYPYDMYGIKADMVFERKSAELEKEIELLGKYISGMYDLIEIVEGKTEGDK